MVNNREIEKIKCTFLGEPESQKSQIINLIKKEKSTLGIDFAIYKTQVEGKEVHFNLWDTAGNERYNTLLKSSLRDSKIVFLFFSYQNINTFNAIKKWHVIALENVPGATIHLLGFDDKSGSVLGENEIAYLATEISSEFSIIEKEDSVKFENVLHTIIKTIQAKKINQSKEESTVENKNEVPESQGFFSKIKSEALLFFAKRGLTTSSRKTLIDTRLDELQKEQDAPNL